MFSLKNIRVSQKFYFLIAVVVFCFIAIMGTYFVQMSAEQKGRQKQVFFDENERLLGEISADLFELGRSSTEHFTSSAIDTRVGVTDKNQFQLRTSLAENLSTLKSRVQEVNTLAGLKETEQQLNSFDSISKQLTFQNEYVGQIAKSGLLLELAKASEKFESELVEINSTSIGSIILDVRAQEQSLIASPTAEGLFAIDEKIYRLLTLLSGVQQSEEKLEDRRFIVDQYFEKLSQYVTATEDIAVLELDLSLAWGKLNEGFSTVEASAKKYFGNELKALTFKSQLFLKFFVVVTLITFVLIILAIILLAKTISFSLEQVSEVLDELNDGEVDSRVSISSKDEFGLLAQSLNVFLDNSAHNLRKVTETLNAQSGHIDALSGPVSSMITEKEYEPLFEVQGRVGGIAKSINDLNFNFFKLFSRVKETAITVDDLSSSVLKQSVSIGQITNDELKQVLVTTKALKLSSRAMEEISLRAKEVGEIVALTSSSLNEKQKMALASAKNYESVQVAICSAKERMETLVELSQYIQGIVDTSNAVADRSHILSLNISMRSNASGVEEGVEVEDVKAFSQHAQQASKEVFSMVEATRNNIFDTINTMNELIEHVVHAFTGVKDMNTEFMKVEESYKNIEETVKVIAGGSDRQASLMKKVYECSDTVRRYIEASSQQVERQKDDANSLKNNTESFIAFVDSIGFSKEWSDHTSKVKNSEGSEDLLEECV